MDVSYDEVRNESGYYRDASASKNIYFFWQECIEKIVNN